MSHSSHHHQPLHEHQPPLYSPSAYAQVPAVPTIVPTAPPIPARTQGDAGAEYGHSLHVGGAGVDLGAAFPPTPYTPYSYHGHHQGSSPPSQHVSPALPHPYQAGHDPSVRTPNAPIPMPEPQRPSRAPPLPHRRNESFRQPAPHASVLSPPMTATTQLLMPSPPSTTNTNILVPSHLFEEPIASSQGSASYLVERVPVDETGHNPNQVIDVDIFGRRHVLVPTGRSPPASTSLVPIAASAASSASAGGSASASGSLTRPPATAAVVPPQPNPAPSSLSHPTLPDWAKDPDDDRPPIRSPVYFTPPFVLKLLFVLISLAGIITIRIVLPAYVAATSQLSSSSSSSSPTFLLAYQWLLVVTLAYALVHLGSYSSCFYNRHARKVSVSAQRQAWKLRVRRWLLLPLELALTLTWLIMTLIIGLVKNEWALYLNVCSAGSSSDLVGARIGVSCTQATTVLVLAGIMASMCGISVGQLVWATLKNHKKVRQFKPVDTQSDHGEMQA
ncbi:hypothetical protein BCR44DRAFT_1120184 [Catenaria anguillulae PL171]|uniref:Uncharacterized protein n=1 Tax=Catenaria anguillulae PL171 TaxID=765915 RepID=A0A1Y2HLL9_9FUNG|nr:hypothetical protein BCR44DRAFT_1120184 [Catenaria anguillulae PL171]